MAESKKKTSIEILIDDCLLEAIFHHLSIVDRVKIERVSKRWNKLSKSSWSNVKKLDLNPPSWGFKPRKFLLDWKKIQLCEITEVLERCGKFLEVVDLRDLELRNVFEMIAYYCPNVKSLLLTVHSFDGVNDLSKNCKSITELTLYYLGFSDQDFDNELSKLFKNNKSLRRLNMSCSLKFTGLCFLNLSQLEELEILFGACKIKPHHFVNAVKIMNNLKVLKLSLGGNIINDAILALQKCPNLEELFLIGRYKASDFPDEETKLGRLFRNTEKLKIVALCAFYLTGKCLNNFNCIEELQLTNCNNLNLNYLNTYKETFKNLSRFEYYYYGNFISHNEMSTFISSLTKAKYIKITINQQLIDVNNYISIPSLTNLEKIFFRGSYVTDDCLKTIAKNFKNLKVLNLSFCDVTDDGLYIVTGLPKLEEVSLKWMENVTDNGFNKMLNLQKLKCRWCENIKNDGLKKILKESTKLIYLFIWSCGITEDFLLFANEITKKRSNDNILYINKYSIDLFTNERLDNYDANVTNNLKSIEKSPFLDYTDIEPM